MVEGDLRYIVGCGFVPLYQEEKDHVDHEEDQHRGYDAKLSFQNILLQIHFRTIPFLSGHS